MEAVVVLELVESEVKDHMDVEVEVEVEHLRELPLGLEEMVVMV